MGTVRVTTAIRHGGTTVRVVEAVTTTSHASAGGGRLVASLEPVAVIVADGQTTVALDMDGNPVDVSRLGVSLDEPAAAD